MNKQKSNVVQINSDSSNKEIAISEAKLSIHHADSAVAHAIECGKYLKLVKADLPHGEFIPWIEANMPIGVSQCKRYMRVFSYALNSPREDDFAGKSIRQIEDMRMADEKRDADEKKAKSKAEADAKKASEPENVAEIKVATKVATKTKVNNPVGDIKASTTKNADQVKRMSKFILDNLDAARSSLLHSDPIMQASILAEYNIFEAIMNTVISRKHVKEDVTLMYEWIKFQNRYILKRSIKESLPKAILEKEEALNRREHDIALREKRIKGKAELFSDKEIKIIKSALHPDRQSTPDQRNKALSIFNKVM